MVNNNGKSGIGGIGAPVEKELYFPIVVEDNIDEEVMKLQKTTEDKIYLVLYYNLETEEHKYEKFIGRYDCYFGIKRIVDGESIDLRSSKVIVETVVYDTNYKKAKRYLNHLDTSLNIIDFCHYVEKFFGDNAYNIEEYDTGIDVEDTEGFWQIPDTSGVSFGDISTPNIANIYNEANGNRDFFHNASEGKEI